MFILKYSISILSLSLKFFVLISGLLLKFLLSDGLLLESDDFDDSNDQTLNSEQTLK